jgi:hypothetical protein
MPTSPEAPPAPSPPKPLAAAPPRPVGLRVAPDSRSTEPVVWTERQCPSCLSSYPRTVPVCPADGTKLRRVEVSLPFIWIG